MKRGPLVVNGWTVIAHELFLSNLEQLFVEAAEVRARHAGDYTSRNAFKRLAAVIKLYSKLIPADPSSDAFRQGRTLGPGYTHWRRAKFYQQYRLFFRYHSPSKVIIIGWLNDGDTLRAYGSRSDAYAVFRNMLDSGRPPDDWDMLLVDASSDVDRFVELMDKVQRLFSVDGNI